MRAESDEPSGANTDALYGRAHVCSMNDADALQHDLPEDEPTDLLRLPPELLHEIAIWAPLRTFGQVTRLDARRVACIRLQRWYRSIERRDATMQLSVGDRVLVKPRAARQRMEYATAAAKVDDGRSWKVRMLDDVYLTIPTSPIRRLAEWVDGPWASSVGRSAALASASRARRAAMHAAAMAAQALRAGAPSSQTALVIAAASTASMAAAAATAASSAVAPIAANAFANTQEAHELLMATQQMQDAITDVGIAGGGLEHACGGLATATAAVCDRNAAVLVAQAASAAAEAAREAWAATSAALAVDSIDSLTVTASAVSRAASAAQQVVSAVEALEGAPDASGAAAVSAVEIAAEALTDVRAAGRALTNSPQTHRRDASDGGGASASTAHALDAAQAAAQVLRAAASDVASLLDPSLPTTHTRAKYHRAKTDVKLAVAPSPEELRRAVRRQRTPPPSFLPDCQEEVGDNIDELIRDGASTVLWCWLPRSSAWTESEIVERTTRAVAACRTHDLIALPDLPVARELIEHWSTMAYGLDHLDASCVLWFAPDMVGTEDEISLDLRDQGPLDGGDPAFVTLLSVLHKYRTCGRRVDAIYTMYPDARTCRVAQAFDLRCLGDLDAHPIIGSLRQAKSFLHPSLAHPCRPALRDAALSHDVRGPRGFCCETPEQLLEAWERLKAIDAAMPLVLKPAAGSGGDGVRLNATVADLHSVVAQMRSNARTTTQHGRFSVASMNTEEETILEEMVGEPGQPSPTVYVVGAHVTVVADQLLTPCGTANLGNLSPATQVAPNVVEVMVRACVALGTHLGLRGQWGVDFVLDAMAMPVMVDLNMGRPNGSLSYYCWRARQPPPPHQPSEVSAEQDHHTPRARQELGLACTTFYPPAGLRLAALAHELQKRGLLWNESHGEGIVIAQYLPSGGSVLAASWQGTQAARRIMDDFVVHMSGAAERSDEARNADADAAAARAATGRLTWKELPLHERLFDHAFGCSLFEVPSFATEAECEGLIAAAVKVAALHEDEKGQSRVRVPAGSSSAARRLHSKLFERLLSFLESEMPVLALSLFGQDTELASMNVSYSAGEPAVIIYKCGGEFKPHTDNEHLSLLIPLDAPGAFGGGGTAFWRAATHITPDVPYDTLLTPEQNERNRWTPPDVSLKPALGTALLFGGDVLHGGLPVTWGTRHLFVMSFTLRPGFVRRED